MEIPDESGDGSIQLRVICEAELEEVELISDMASGYLRAASLDDGAVDVVASQVEAGVIPIPL